MSTTFSTKCLPGTTAMAPAGAPRSDARAHTLQRRPAHSTDSGAPRLTAPALEYREPQSAAPASTTNPLNLLPGRPLVLLVDPDATTAGILSNLVVPEAQLVHAPTLTIARKFLQSGVFSLVVIDPALPDGDARTLLPMLGGTPVLVYSAHQPEWRDTSLAFLPKPWTSTRQLWSTISGLIGTAGMMTPGDA